MPTRTLAAITAVVALIALADSGVAHASAEQGGAASTIPQQCDGFTITPVSVPDGFDPLAATDEQLDAAGLPPRPTPQNNPDYDVQIADWTHFVTHPITPWTCDDVVAVATHSEALPPVDPPSVSAASPRPTTQPEAYFNWAGFEALYHSYRSAEGTWTIPWTTSDSSHIAAQYVQGVGIGEGDTEDDPLVQAGSGQYGDDTGSYHPWLWWEVFCECVHGNAMQNFQSAGYGDSIYVKVTASGTTDNMYVTDWTNGGGGTFHYDKMTADFNGHTAEWIGERPTIGHDYTALARTAIIPDSPDAFREAHAKWPTADGWKNVGALDRRHIDMWNCKLDNKLMDAGPLNSSNDGFQLTWKAYGHPEPNPCPPS